MIYDINFLSNITVLIKEYGLSDSIKSLLTSSPFLKEHIVIHDKEACINSLNVLIDKLTRNRKIYQENTEDKGVYNELDHLKLKHTYGFKGNLSFKGEWDKDITYIWNYKTEIPIVTYKDILWMCKYIPTQGVPPDKDKDGWMVFPVKGGQGAVEKVVSDNELEIVISPNVGVVHVSIGKNIARVKDLDNKENSLGNPSDDGMVLASTKDGNRTWVKQKSNFTESFKMNFTEKDLKSGFLYVPHYLNQKKYLIIYLFDDFGEDIIPDIIPIDENEMLLNLTNVSPLEGVWRLIVIKA